MNSFFCTKAGENLSQVHNVRLSNLGVLSIESRRAKVLNLDEFDDLFAKKHKNRRIQLM